MPLELPRLVKKPGGLYKRVENLEDLDAALKDGWRIRLYDAASAPVEAVEQAPEIAVEPEPVAPETVSEPDAPVEAEAPAPVVESTRKRGRPRGDAAKKK